MGWLWSSSPAPTTSATSKSDEDLATPAPAEPKRDFGLSDEQRTRIFGRPGAQQASSTSSREQQADAELNEFLRSLEAPSSTPSDTAPVDPTSKQPIAEPELTPHDRVLADGTLNIHPTALYPATMSCRQAFDQAFYCQSLGGKFNDIYRFGHLKDCSEQWGAFWFCMRTRTLPSQDKEGMIREYYRDRDDRRRNENGGSSEDIWELRTKAVERAFWKDPDAEEDGADVRIKE